MLINIKTRRGTPLKREASPGSGVLHSMIDLGKAPEPVFLATPPKLLLPLAENELSKKLNTPKVGGAQNTNNPPASTLIDLGKVPDSSPAVAMPAVLRPRLEIDLGKRIEVAEPGQFRSKVGNPVSSAVPALSTPGEVGPGKANDGTLSRPPEVQGRFSVPAMTDLGKLAEDEPSHPVPPVLRSLLSVDLGKQPEALNSGTATGLSTDDDPAMVKPLSLFKGLVASAGALIVLGFLVAGAMFLHQGSGKPAPGTFPAVAFAVDGQDPISLSPGELRPLQLWSQYSERLAAIAPGSPPSDPWWKIAAEGRLSTLQTDTVHKLQTEVIAALDRVDKPISDVNNGSLVLITTAWNELKQQQTPPNLTFGPDGRALPLPIRDLAGFFKPRANPDANVH